MKLKTYHALIADAFIKKYDSIILSNLKAVRFDSLKLWVGIAIHTLLIAVLPTLAVAASTREVVWTEETPLNSGDTLAVDRKVFYELKSTPGNPLQRSWQPTSSSTSFVWRGKQYVYPGSVMVIAASPSGEIHLIRGLDQEDTLGWEHKCRKPSYFQYVLKDGVWVALDGIEPWVIGLARNQVLNVSLEGTPPNLSVQMRASANARSMYLRRTSGERIVEGDYVSASCNGKV